MYIYVEWLIFHLKPLSSHWQSMRWHTSLYVAYLWLFNGFARESHLTVQAFSPLCRERSQGKQSDTRNVVSALSFYITLCILKKWKQTGSLPITLWPWWNIAYRAHGHAQTGYLSKTTTSELLESNRIDTTKSVRTAQRMIRSGHRFSCRWIIMSPPAKCVYWYATSVPSATIVSWAKRDATSSTLNMHMNGLVPSWTFWTTVETTG